mmetsp:Transcript_1264/g.5648  ORF Transcript_1264/g.5648 Transcript_1264/m.5648 type:complete len:243 (+) Transcript_1264:1537-2265(+)
MAVGRHGHPAGAPPLPHDAQIQASPGEARHPAVGGGERVRLQDIHVEGDHREELDPPEADGRGADSRHHLVLQGRIFRHARCAERARIHPLKVAKVEVVILLWSFIHRCRLSYTGPFRPRSSRVRTLILVPHTRFIRRAPHDHFFDIFHSIRPRCTALAMPTAQPRPCAILEPKLPSSASFVCVYLTPVSFSTKCPSPRHSHLVVKSPSTPTGPRAWMRLVEMPTSAPKPNLNPSEKRVEAL